MIFEKRYYNWLLDKVCTDEQTENYSLLLSKLAFTEFRSSVERDSNLIGHVQYSLRDEFDDEAIFLNIAANSQRGPISLLEIMIVLSVKAEDIMQGFDNVNCSRWFWSMLSCSQLIMYSNDNFNESKVDEIIERILDRTYDWDGRGGLFYIPFSPGVTYGRDLRETELWYQLMWYIDYINS